MPFPRKPGGSGSDKFTRVCVHAVLEFEERVEGPVLLGAGRYFGLGVCRRPGNDI
jgi:CRISPR-associated protein Csb2